MMTAPIYYAASKDTAQLINSSVLEMEKSVNETNKLNTDMGK